LPDQAWTAVLDELEAALPLRGTHGWRPPAGLGPLPAELAPRAFALLAAQRNAEQHGQAELARIGAELSALRRPGIAPVSEAAAYIDTVA
jgi:hypothetical protein